MQLQGLRLGIEFATSGFLDQRSTDLAMVPVDSQNAHLSDTRIEYTLL